MTFEETFIGRPNTIRAYRSLFRNHIEPYVFEKTMGIWNDNTLNTLLREWEDKGLSRRTRMSLVRLTARYVKFLGGPEIHTSPIIRNLDRSEQQTEVLSLSHSQSEALMAACRRLEPRYYPILLLGLHAGLRRGEIFGLRCSDLDFLKGRVRVAHSYDGPTKNGKTRFVPMSKALSKALMDTRGSMFRHADDLVFEKQDPNPTLRRLCHVINAQSMRFHDLRHTYATLALEAGVSPRIVANWLGHSSVTTTLSIYWNLTTDEADVNEFLP